MDTRDLDSATRVGAYGALGGAACALVGVAFWVASGADIDLALATDTIPEYLVTAGANAWLVKANLTAWIVMVFLMGAGGVAMAALGTARPVFGRIAALCYATGIAIVITAYVAWLAIVVQVAPDTSPAAVRLTATLGWFASRMDWIATILVLGAGPFFLCVAGRDVWVPRWLARWSGVAVLAAALNALAMLTGGAGLTTYGFVIVPVGVSWMVAAGIVLLRRIGRVHP